MLNFAEQTGSGAVTLVWSFPQATLFVMPMYPANEAQKFVRMMQKVEFEIKLPPIINTLVIIIDIRSLLYLAGNYIFEVFHLELLLYSEG